MAEGAEPPADGARATARTALRGAQGARSPSGTPHVLKQAITALASDGGFAPAGLVRSGGSRPRASEADAAPDEQRAVEPASPAGAGTEPEAPAAQSSDAAVAQSALAAVARDERSAAPAPPAARSARADVARHSHRSAPQLDPGEIMAFDI